MDLLLWRHAEAVEGSPDRARELSTRGREQARRMGRWLAEHRPRELRILVSPTIRTRQTALALTRDFEIVPSIGPEAGVADLIAAAGWPQARGACLIVGHQPTLGRLAALLLCGAEADWTIKKGAVWWFNNRVREGEPQTVLRLALPADFA